MSEIKLSILLQILDRVNRNVQVQEQTSKFQEENQISNTKILVHHRGRKNTKILGGISTPQY